ncbi:unnamed protein product [Aspergillus oryzae var. brunneus]|uniref:Unnamed protein product n=2 Tax=Aspergillus oryzae TaxID=5062 RepID=A0AAN5BUJ8_ASPOZ|nr:unnamed protein product [Aspergillus oryzae]GMG33483.1 unnamed protein product [Aspergillus oryzae]GMG50439.1 unnamed protein product [Aspergillus oryzae var. brunneus]
MDALVKDSGFFCVDPPYSPAKSARFSFFIDHGESRIHLPTGNTPLYSLPIKQSQPCTGHSCSASSSFQAFFHLSTPTRAGSGKAVVPTLNGTVDATHKRGLSDKLQQIQSAEAMLKQSKDKVLSKMTTCQEPNVGANNVLQSTKRDDEEKCTLDEALEELLDEVTDALECLLSVAFPLLGGVVDLVSNILGGIVNLASEILDLD